MQLFMYFRGMTSDFKERQESGSNLFDLLLWLLADNKSNIPAEALISLEREHFQVTVFIQKIFWMLPLKTQKMGKYIP